VLIAETISNPLLKLCDIEACAEIAAEVRARLIIDNTFASPFLCQPLKLGAHFAVHSATKYLAGHADAMGGLVVAADKTDLNSLIGIMKLAGGVLGVWDAHEISRGVKTLGSGWNGSVQTQPNWRQTCGIIRRFPRCSTLALRLPTMRFDQKVVSCSLYLGSGFDRTEGKDEGGHVSIHGQVAVVYTLDQSR